MKEKYRMYQLDPVPPELDLQECIDGYLDTGDTAFLAQFLHWYEPAINNKAESFGRQYAMTGHFGDLKQS